uniref:Cytochrome b n=1 Tax=Liposcelis bostrychophila TaxID=185214 RepID=A0A3Q8BY57_LIPBO|nr:cytochrome b [Liposcelis bostrychophila]ATU74602.1 cytochrome b [Liposcelis bostrychophila]UNO31816.1 cytochrome b [Liposcelis bostrychophila]
MKSLLNLPTPSTINYFWNLGSLLGLCLSVQILTGVFLTMFFKADLNQSFSSVVSIMNNINNGWVIRFIHSTGASMFFIICYAHIGKALFFSSFYFWKIWFSGLILVLFLMMEAFLGYVLPWGQMSFWGATVITNLISVIPYFGPLAVQWLWGGFNVGDPTLTRFLSFHFIIPFVMIAMSGVHLILLHETGSSNPLGLPLDIDKISFSKFFIIKDLVTLILILMGLILLGSMYPFMFMDPENFLKANPMVTPIHIQPEWYFLFAYAILRSVPNKLGGVLMLILSIIIILALPLLSKSKMKGLKFSFFKWMLYFHFGTFTILTWLGMQPVEDPYIYLGKIYSVLYFTFYFLF